MSIRVSTTSWIPGAVLCGNRGLGMTGSAITEATASGTSGPGLIYPSLDGAPDNDKEFCIRIKTVPTSGSLFVDEYGAFTHTGAANGIYSIVADLYEDGVNLGELTFSITVGTLQLTKDYTSTFNLLGIITIDLISSFNIRGSLEKDYNSNFNIRGIVTNDRVASYIIRNLLVKDQVFAYIIDGNYRLTKDRNFLYNILQNITSDAITIILNENEPITVFVK